MTQEKAIDVILDAITRVESRLIVAKVSLAKAKKGADVFEFGIDNLIQAHKTLGVILDQEEDGV